NDYYYYYGYFTIAEFRVPEYEVGVTSSQSEVFSGEDLNAVVEASYYFGGGVSDADLYWSAYASTSSFNYTGVGRYSFSDEDWGYVYSQYIGDGSSTTDSNGQ